MNTEKVCAKCKVLKPLEQYHVQPAGKFGRTARCKDCANAEHKAYKERVMPLSQKEARLRKQKLLTRGLKECLCCHEVKSRTDFYLANGKPTSPCKECKLEIHKVWKGENKEHMLAYVREYTRREEVKSRRDENRIRRKDASPRQVMQITLRHGLERRPTETPATIDDLMAKFNANKGRCALTGIVMTWGKGTVLPTSISLDRIDPNQGYSDDNLRLVCHAINAFKGRMSDNEMFGMALALIGNMKRPKLRLVS